MRTAVKASGLTLLLAAGVFWPVGQAPRPDEGRDPLIVNVRVIDVRRGVAGPPSSVLVRAGAVAAVGIGANPPGVPVLDARGGYVVPGFRDMHVHSF